MAVGSDHHCNFYMLVSQPGDTSSPFPFYCGPTFKFKTEFGKKGNGVVEGFYHNANIVHAY